MKLVLLCFLLLAGSAAAGQGDSTGAYRWKKFNSFGFNASSVSGLGLSYRHHTEGPQLFMLSGGIVSSKDWVYASLGGEFQYEISERDDLRYYLALAGGFYYTNEDTYDYWLNTTYNNTDSDFHLGIGVGFEYPFLGSTIFKNMTIGVTLYYPAIFFTNSGTEISMGAGAYFFYNF